MIKRFLPITVVLVVGGLGVLTLVAANAQSVKLAIIAPDAACLPVADVLTAECSKVSTLTLLERAEVNRVLAEQKLSSVTAADYVKLGQLLAADGLVALAREAREGKEILTARLIAVKPGVTLTIEAAPWPLQKPDEWSRLLVPRLVTFGPKLAVLAKDAIPISVLNLRSSVRAPAAQEAERELTQMLIHRLTRERDVFVLERQHLHAALLEQELKPELKSAFWTGRYLLDGTLDKDGFDAARMTVNARLVSPQGGPPTTIEVTGPRTNLTLIAQSLATKVLNAVHRTPSVDEWRPLAEADQFYEEAKWAFRWSLWEDAQAASESSWALGRRTPEVAALRIRACGETVMRIDPGIGNLTIPAAPEANGIEPATRATELFCRDALLVFTNAVSPNAEWFELGVQTFRRAVALLDGFYHAAEMRRGNEEALTTLRRAAREIVPLLDANIPTNRRSAQVVEKFTAIKWDQGGVIFDRPEDSMEMFRRILKDGLIPHDLPRVVGWSWADRKRVPEVMRRFVEGLRASTNFNVRLEGIYLALVREPFDAEGKFQAREAELLATIWDSRSKLPGDPRTASIVPRTGVALAAKYRYIYSSRFDREPYVSLVHNLRKDYLQNSPTWNEDVFNTLIPNAALPYTPSEAAELAPLIEQFVRRLAPKEPGRRYTEYALTTLNRVAGNTNRLPAATKPVDYSELFPLSGEAGGMETVRFKPWQLKPEGTESFLEPKVRRVVSRGEKLWALVFYVGDRNSFLMNCPSVYVAVELKTGRCEEIPFPTATAGFPGENFEVTDDSLYVSLPDQLQRYRFQTKMWERVPAPLQTGASITATKGRVYLATREGLLELNPVTQRLQVLVSSRRRPAENELDSLWEQGARVFTWPDGRLAVLVLNFMFALDDNGQEWKKVTLPFDWRRYGRIPFISGEGVELLLSGVESRQRMIGVGELDAKLELIFEKAGKYEFRDPTFEKIIGPAKWNWPAPFELDYPCLFAEGGGLWAWQPRNLGRFYAPHEPVTFHDERHATLLRFEPGQSQPLSVGFRFEKDSAVFDPFDPHNLDYRMSALQWAAPICLATPDGLVVACWAAPGHWFIPKAALEERFKTLRGKLTTNSTGGTTK